MKKTSLTTLAILAALASAAFCGGGCTSFVTATGANKVITTVTVKTFGIMVGVTPQNSTPQVTLGSQITEVQFMPCATNGPIATPNFATTYGLKDNASPFTFDGNDTMAGGDYQTWSLLSSNGMSSQPIVPR